MAKVVKESVFIKILQLSMAVKNLGGDLLSINVDNKGADGINDMLLHPDTTSWGMMPIILYDRARSEPQKAGRIYGVDVYVTVQKCSAKMTFNGSEWECALAPRHEGDHKATGVDVTWRA